MDKIVVIGAKGLAYEILFSFPEIEEKFIFFDDINPHIINVLNKFKVLKTIYELREQFNNNKFNFVLGVGGASNKKFLYEKFTSEKGNNISLISKNAKIGNYQTDIKKGSIVLDGALVTNNVKIGTCCLINKQVIISHDACIGSFSEISPGAKIMGNVTIGESVEIGAGAIILPKLNVGNNVTIGAGAVVLKDIPDNSVVVGNPGKIIKTKNQ